MSISTPDIIMGRIRVATKQSPIAVFEHPEPGLLRAVFGATDETRREGDKHLIGIYHNRMSPAKIKKELIKAAR